MAHLVRVHERARGRAFRSASCTLTSSRGDPGEKETCVHAAHMSRLGWGFNQARRAVSGAGFPVAIAPGLPERYGGFRFRRWVDAMAAARPAADEAGKRHPPPSPPAMPGNAFSAIFAAGRVMLATRAKKLQRLARAMLVDGKKHIGCAPAQGHQTAARAARALSMAATAASKASSVEAWRGG